MLPSSTCSTGSSLVPVDQRGNALKCHIPLGARSQSSPQLMLFMSRHLVGWERAQRGGEKWRCVCSHPTPCALIVKMSDLSLPSLLSSPSPFLSPPALYLLMDPFNYLLHILGRQQTRAQYTGVEMIQHTNSAGTRQSGYFVELIDWLDTELCSHFNQSNWLCIVWIVFWWLKISTMLCYHHNLP